MDSTFDVYRKTFKQQFTISAITSSIIYLLITLTISYVKGSLFVGEMEVAEIIIHWALISFIIIPVIVIPIYSFSQIPSMVITKNYVLNRKGSLKSILFESIKLLPRNIFAQLSKYFIYSVALYCGSLVLGFIFSIIFLFSAMLLVGSISAFGIIIALVVSIFSVAIIIGVFMVLSLFDTLFILTTPSAIFDKRLFFGAIAKSSSLVSKNHIENVQLNVMMTLLILLISYGVSSGLVFIFSIQKTIFVSDFLMSSSFAISIMFTAITRIFVAPLKNIFLTLLYYNQLHFEIKPIIRK